MVVVDGGGWWWRGWLVMVPVVDMVMMVMMALLSWQCHWHMIYTSDVTKRKITIKKFPWILFQAFHS